MTFKDDAKFKPRLYALLSRQPCDYCATVTLCAYRIDLGAHCCSTEHFEALAMQQQRTSVAH